jgi:protein gp37
MGDPQAEDGIDPACRGCYARAHAENPFWWGGQTMFPVWVHDARRRFFDEKHYLEPLKWNRAAEKSRKPEHVFCMSMGDWAEGRPDQHPYLDKYLFPIIEETQWLIWLLLTKRPQIAGKIVPERWQRDGWPKNAWPSVSAVTQQWWDIRLPHLLTIRALRHFVSAEPLMERIDMRLTEKVMECQQCQGKGLRNEKPCRVCLDSAAGQAYFSRPSWIIVGGQSGTQARPMHPDWPRAIRDQCVAVGVPFFFTQWGDWAPNQCNGISNQAGMVRIGKKALAECFMVALGIK